MPVLNVPNRSMFTDDNLDILRGINSDTIDLIYVDPPRNTGKTLLASPNSLAKGYFYPDEWTADHTHPEWKHEIAARRPRAMQLIDSFRLVCDEGMVNYFVFLAVRLLELQRVLKDTGSIYLQCSPDSAHYLKAVMDAIFGREQFKSDITFKRIVQTGGPQRWRWVHDSLLFYAGPRRHRWNQVPQPHTYDYREMYDFKDERGKYHPTSLTHKGLTGDDRDAAWRGYTPGDHGRHWEVPLSILELHYPGVDLTGLGTIEKLDMLDKCGRVHWPTRGFVPRYKRYVDESDGEPLSDVVTTIGRIDQKSQEGTGWPGQVHKAMLDIIIRASSNPGDVVLDPFGGSGTACVVAENLNRRWIAIEVSAKGFDVLESRMRREAGQTEIYEPLELPFRTDQSDFSERPLMVDERLKAEIYDRQRGRCTGCQYDLPVHVLTTALTDAARESESPKLDDLQLLCHHCNMLRGEGDMNHLKVQLYQEHVL